MKNKEVDVYYDKAGNGGKIIAKLTIADND